MINRYTAIDIRDKIIDMLTNGSTDVNGVVRKSVNQNLLDIDGKRNTSTIQPLVIDYKWNYNQSPNIIIDVGNSSLLNEEILSANYEITPELFNVDVVFKIKTVDNLCQDMVENYIEAIISSLHGYSDCNIQWVLVTETDREELYQDVNQTEKAGMVKLEIRIN